MFNSVFGTKYHKQYRIFFGLKIKMYVTETNVLMFICYILDELKVVMLG